MILETPHSNWLDASPATRYVAPFVIFFVFLTLFPYLPLSADWEAPLRVGLLAVVCVVCWPADLSTRPRSPGASVLLGAGVFLLWIAPDHLIPGYRNNVLFSNSLIGHTHSSLSAGVLHSDWVLFWRTVRATLIVPIVEELFWRGWLMRWMISTDFRKVPLGTYSPLSFFLTALLFASEHGPYWDVGLLTGVIYNWWMIRTKSVASCVLMHAVTNGLLSAYVISTGHWEYWQ